MPQTPYFVKTISLASIIAQGQPTGLLAPKGMRVTDVGVLTLPSGAAGNIFLHLGQKGDAIPLHLAGQNFHMSDPEDTGIWVSVPAAIGAIDVRFLISLQSTVSPQY